MNNPPKPYSPEAQREWLDALSPDERFVVCVTGGHKMAFIIAALFKRALQDPKLSAADRLFLLEGLDGLTDSWLAPEMIALVEPLSDTGYEIFELARSLDKPHPKNKSEINSSHFKAGFDVLESPRVFWHLCTLNPSIIAAIKWREAQTSAAAAVLRALYPVERASEQTTAPERTLAPERTSSAPDPYGHNIPGDFVRRHEIPARFFAIGTPGHPDGDINPHTGR